MSDTDELISMVKWYQERFLISIWVGLWLFAAFFVLGWSAKSISDVPAGLTAADMVAAP